MVLIKHAGPQPHTSLHVSHLLRATQSHYHYREDNNQTMSQTLGYTSLQGRTCRLPAGRQGAVRVFSAIAGERKPKYERPDITGRYGTFGGRYVPETLIPALDELEIEYKKAMLDPAFKVSFMHVS